MTKFFPITLFAINYNKYKKDRSKNVQKLQINSDRSTRSYFFAVFATIILLARNFLLQYLSEIVINVIEINFIKLGENNMREFV